MLTVSVKGGTGAGKRAPRERPEDWTCPACGTDLRYWWVKCPNDSTPRPSKETA